MAKRAAVKREWKTKNVEIKIARGAKEPWWFVEINGKKFVMRQVEAFWDEKKPERSKEPF